MSKKKIIITIGAVYIIIGISFAIFTFIVFEKPENLANPQTVENFTIFGIIYLFILGISVSVLINMLKAKLLSEGLQKVFKNIKSNES